MRRRRGAALVALASLALWPLVPLGATLLPMLQPLERALAVWFELSCHRDPARTPVLLGVPFAVCARCSGIYLGLGLGAALRWPALSAKATRVWLALAVLLMLGDVAFEHEGWHGALMVPRLVTGLLLAYPVGARLGFALLPAGSGGKSAQSP